MLGDHPSATTLTAERRISQDSKFLGDDVALSNHNLADYSGKPHKWVRHAKIEYVGDGWDGCGVQMLFARKCLSCGDIREI